MASHFSTIGFDLESEEDFYDLANRLAPAAESIAVAEGAYLRWASPSGAEVWLQVDREGDLIGMVPHFTGGARLRAALLEPVARPEDTALDGAFKCLAELTEDDPPVGQYYFVFDMPDYCRHAGLEVPCIRPVQVAAFAHEITVFESPEAYEAAQPEGAMFASRSFIPSGLFTPGEGPTEPPEAFGIFTGHILETATRTNEASGLSFTWALTDSLGGSFDVIVHPDLLEEEPRIGGVLTGHFWLSGRLGAAEGP
jgi:hypothetical protein